MSHSEIPPICHLRWSLEALATQHCPRHLRLAPGLQRAAALFVWQRAADLPDPWPGRRSNQKAPPSEHLHQAAGLSESQFCQACVSSCDVLCQSRQLCHDVKRIARSSCDWDRGLLQWHPLRCGECAHNRAPEHYEYLQKLQLNQSWLSSTDMMLGRLEIRRAAQLPRP